MTRDIVLLCYLAFCIFIHMFSLDARDREGDFVQFDIVLLTALASIIPGINLWVLYSAICKRIKLRNKQNGI